MTQADKNNQEIILEYPGLGQNARGKGLGKKFKLHTSDQDHPNALPNYLKAGFKITDERLEKQE